MTEQLPHEPRLSLTAVASLVCGLLGWLVITAPIAVVTGIIALRITRRPDVRGRGMAMGGLILGLIFGALGIALAGVGYSWYRWGINQVSNRLPQVVNAAIDGRPMDPATYDGMSPQAVAAVRERTAGWGHLQQVDGLRLSGQRVDGAPDQMLLTGQATFEHGGVKPFDVTIEAKGNEIGIVDVTFSR